MKWTLIRRGPTQIPDGFWVDYPAIAATIQDRQNKGLWEGHWRDSAGYIGIGAGYTDDEPSELLQLLSEEEYQQYENDPFSLPMTKEMVERLIRFYPALFTASFPDVPLLDKLRRR